MPRRSQRTIQRRLSVAIALSVLLALCVVGSILVPVTSSRRMDTLVTDLQATGRILAHNLVASVEFDDAGDATKILASLNAKPSVVRAWIVRGDSVWAQYGGTPADWAPVARDGEVDGRLYFTTEIVRVGAAHYELVLADDLSGYRTGFWLDVAILLGTMLVAFGALIFLTGRLAKRISRPLSELAQHAQRLSNDERYAARIATEEGGEIGTLFSAFAQMLAGIRARDTALLEAQARAEARAAEAERAREDLAISLHSIADAFLACDAEGLVTRMNPVAEELTGWSSGQAIGRPIDEVYRVLDLQGEQPLEAAGRAVLSLRGELAGNAAALLVARDGRRTPVSDHAAPILDHRGAVVGAVLVARDMREQFELEERLRQGQKMEAIGQLAGGVAHDFNNLLTGILGYVDMIEARLGHGAAIGGEVQGHLHGIRNAAERAADLTGQLLAFSRRGRLKREPVDVHGLLRATAGILQHTIGPKITLQMELRAQHPVVVGDASQLQSAFLNLGVNARDAMPGGGVLTFATRDLADDEVVPKDGEQASGHLELQVQDTGVGIEAHLLDKIFEPFFTTKKLGEGTGLGLAAVYGTMESHHGSVRVQSAPGVGTTFTCVLPTVASPAAMAVPAPARPVEAPAASRLVLVADDEEMLRRVAENLLRRLGCEVLLANNGAEALQLFELRHSELSLVLMDVHMPELDGQEAYVRMREIDPAVPILMTTGSSIEPGSFRGAGSENFVQKPYTFASLTSAVERLLEGGSRAAP
ncbi:MAG: response regulator [Planctomycetes bacterium]|nr:response regulator [Planctomycetota bacterium]MCB9885046.1 response regulator [Planctomycetota bacterium]